MDYYEALFVLLQYHNGWLNRSACDTRWYLIFTYHSYFFAWESLVAGYFRRHDLDGHCCSTKSGADSRLRAGMGEALLRPHLHGVLVHRRRNYLHTILALM